MVAINVAMIVVVFLVGVDVLVSVPRLGQNQKMVLKRILSKCKMFVLRMSLHVVNNICIFSDIAFHLQKSMKINNYYPICMS